MRRILCLVIAAFAFCGNLPLAADESEQKQVLITGHVVGEDKQPVAGVAVTSIGWRDTRQSVKTAADGRIEIPTPAAQNGYIHAAFLAEAADGRLGFLSFSQEKPEPVQIVLKAARQLAVEVQDRAGKPAAGADVQLLSAMRTLFTGQTGANGRINLRVPADSQRWAVVARKSQVGFDYANSERGRGSVEELHPLPERLTLKLDGARTVRVKAVDAAGKPVAGVKVGPWYVRKIGYEADMNPAGSFAWWSTTGEDGVAVLDWLPERFDQALAILNHAEGLYSAEHAVSILAEKPADELTISLLPLARLAGRVMHADGRPAAGIQVLIRGQGTTHNSYHGAVRTDGEGRYSAKVYTEQAYLLAVSDEKWAAPCRADILIRAGQPVSSVDFVLEPATHVRGQVTVGKDKRPVPNMQIAAVMDKGRISAELPRQPDDRSYYGLRLQLSAQTDAEGRYVLHLGPGEYRLQGPPRSETETIVIPAPDAAAEIVRDFHMERAETGPFAVQVVDAAGKPVAGATVEGRYSSQHARRWFNEMTTDAEGRVRIERSLDPLVLFARTADGKLAGVARVDADAAEARIVVGPVAIATGRLKDLEGKPLAGKQLSYGIRIYEGEEGSSPFSDSFGRGTTTDAKGEFTLERLVPGETYSVSLKLDEHSSRSITEATAKDAQAVSLGELSADPEPTKPYVPPTPAERAAEAFAARSDMPMARRLKFVLAEAQREYTRPMLLFGRPESEACVELFRLFYERDDAEDKDKAKQELPSPNELRWEFELPALDTQRPEVRELAERLKIDIADEKAPVLAVLTDDGKLTESFALKLQAGKLDSQSLGAWMARHKLPTRDAVKMLEGALAKAKAEDKRVFFITSASWCGPCRLLARFLAPHKGELEKHFVFVKLDISRDDRADELRERYKESASGGVPWYCILDAEAKVLITSNVPQTKPRPGNTNMGFPTQPVEIEHFLNMLKTTAPGLPDEKLGEFRLELLKKK